MAVVHPTDPDAGAGRQRSAGHASGFSAADLAWERRQERAALAWRAGDAATSARLWQETLAIADKQFGRADPRLAASLTNQALVMRRRRQDYQAQRLFENAFAVWDASWRWIYLMTPSHRASLPQPAASDQLGTYGPAARAHLMALAERGCAATATLERFDRLPEDGLAAWLEIKPRRLCDLRKLLAAVLLIAPKPR